MNNFMKEFTMTAIMLSCISNKTEEKEGSVKIDVNRMKKILDKENV